MGQLDWEWTPYLRIRVDVLQWPSREAHRTCSAPELPVSQHSWKPVYGLFHNRLRQGLQVLSGCQSWALGLIFWTPYHRLSCLEREWFKYRGSRNARLAGGTPNGRNKV